MQATLAALTARTIADAACPRFRRDRTAVRGGGANNATLLRMLGTELEPCIVATGDRGVAAGHEALASRSRAKRPRAGQPTCRR
jgi:1,6-anhydro-N-acetylmuramate kinase